MEILEKFKAIRQQFEFLIQKNSLDKKILKDLYLFEEFLKEKKNVVDQETENYKRLFENLEDYIFILSGDGTVLSVNAAACKKYKIPYDEFINTPVIDIDVSDNQEAIMKNIEDLLATGSTRFEAVHKSREGDTFNVDVVAQKVIWHNEPAYIHICRDITRQKKLQKALNESEIKLKKIIDQITHGIIIFEKSGKIVIWNRGAERITGIKKEDAVGKIMYELQYELLHGKYKNKELVKERFDEVVNMINQEVFKKLVENDILVHGHEVKTIQANVFPIEINSDYQLFGTVFGDITERKRTENQLNELNKTREKIFSVIAHDLRTPFNSIIGFTDLLLENYEKYDAERIHKILKYINLSARPMLEVLTNLLNWVTSQSGQMEFTPELAHLKLIVKEVIEIMNPTAKIKNITLQNSLQQDYVVFADVNMLKSVLQNLIANAIKFSHAGGKVELLAHPADDFVELEVVDSGIGIEKHKLGKLFLDEPHASTKGTLGEKGSGLGLILCKEFIEKHGGEIRVESVLGEGSRFIFTVPATPKVAAASVQKTNS